MTSASYSVMAVAANFLGQRVSSHLFSFYFVRHKYQFDYYQMHFMTVSNAY